MPVLLVFIITMIEDSAINILTDKQISLLYVDNDHDSLGISIDRTLNNTNAFTVVKEMNGQKITAEKARDLVAKGDFAAAVIIPKGSTDTLRSNARAVVKKSFVDLGMIKDTNFDKHYDSVQMLLLFDPAAKMAVKAIVAGAVGQSAYMTESRMVYQTYSEFLSKMMPDGKSLSIDYPDMISFKKEFASTREAEILPNTTQHNVPAWTLFCMFFIVLPLSGSIIQEKGEGAYLRLKTMPNTLVVSFLGKLIVYFLVCIIQVLILFSIGVYLIQYVNLPALQLGSHPMALITTIMVSAFAAVGFGVMIGTLSTTYQQAAAFGTGIVIIMSAIGGLWMPIYMMPQAMIDISGFSPLNWALKAYYAIFLRDAGLSAVLKDTFRLFLFGAGSFSVALIYQRFKAIK